MNKEKAIEFLVTCRGEGFMSLRNELDDEPKEVIDYYKKRYGLSDDATLDYIAAVRMLAIHGMWR